VCQVRRRPVSKTQFPGSVSDAGWLSTRCGKNGRFRVGLPAHCPTDQRAPRRIVVPIRGKRRSLGRGKGSIFLGSFSTLRIMNAASS
jgi:hypothetical protein